MKANELRIGNYYYYANDVVGKLSFIDFKLATKKDMIPEYFERLKAIPLTEEWLLKFGFTKWKYCDDCAYIDCNGQQLYLRKWNNEWMARFLTVLFKGSDREYMSAKDYKIQKPPQYVHSLQNLYFALTGEELTLKN